MTTSRPGTPRTIDGTAQSIRPSPTRSMLPSGSIAAELGSPRLNGGGLAPVPLPVPGGVAPGVTPPGPVDGGGLAPGVGLAASGGRDGSAEGVAVGAGVTVGMRVGTGSGGSVGRMLGSGGSEIDRSLKNFFNLLPAFGGHKLNNWFWVFWVFAVTQEVQSPTFRLLRRIHSSSS